MWLALKLKLEVLQKKAYPPESLRKLSVDNMCVGGGGERDSRQEQNGVIIFIIW